MSNSSEMTRWTSPTNTQFYALHKNAISLYHTAAVIVQVVWLVFSTRPLANMVVESIPYLSAYATISAVLVLAFLHYVIHELVRYVFYNWLDDDPNTNSSFGSIASLVVIVGAMLMLDIQGVTSFIRDEKRFESLSERNENEHKTASTIREARFKSDNETLVASFNADLEAIRLQFESKISKVERRKTYDDSDLRKKRRDIQILKNQLNSEIASKKAELATAQRNLLNSKNVDLEGLNKKHTTISGKIDTDNEANKSKANNYGFIVSIFCLITLLFCTYQSTILRVKAGQKPISRYTIADATGSTTTKLADVFTDAFQRQMHRFTVWIHGVLTMGTEELDELDGAFILKKKSNASTANNLPKNGNNDDNNGDNPQPTPIIPPAPAQPVDGENVHLKRVKLNDLPLSHREYISARISEAYLKDFDIYTTLKVISDMNAELSVSDDYKIIRFENPSDIEVKLALAEAYMPKQDSLYLKALNDAKKDLGLPITASVEAYPELKKLTEVYFNKKASPTLSTSTEIVIPQSSVQKEQSSVQKNINDDLIWEAGTPYVAYILKKGDRKGQTVKLDLPQVKMRARQYFREQNATSFKEFYELFQKFGLNDDQLGIPSIGIQRMLLEANKEVGDE